MRRGSTIVLALLWCGVPLLGIAAQQIDVRPAPPQGCKGTPTADSTIYDADEASPGPQLRSFRRLEMPTALRDAGGKGGVTLAAGFEAKNYDSRGFLIRPKRGG